MKTPKVLLSDGTLNPIPADEFYAYFARLDPTEIPEERKGLTLREYVGEKLTGAALADAFAKFGS